MVAPDGARPVSRAYRVVLAAAIVLGGVGTAGATDRCCPALCRDRDSVWLVSTRHLGCAGCQPHCPRLKVWHRQSGFGWTASTTESFVAADDPATITVFYVHGNRVDNASAMANGVTIYHRLARRADEETQLRFVIWSWPSDRMIGPLRDARAKAQRTDSESYYLGCLLLQLDPRLRVSLVGHSFGVRIVTGSLHLLAGGSVAGRVLPVGGGDAMARVRVVGVAGALDNDWLLPGHRHGRAVSLIDQLLVVYNPCDAVLKRYRLISQCRSHEALGYTGLVCSEYLGEGKERIEQINASPWVGKTHSIEAHSRSAVLLNEIRRVAFWRGGSERSVGDAGL